MITVKRILQDNWSNYLKHNSVTSFQQNEVEKALDCYSIKNGCFVYVCDTCGEYFYQKLGCNSRLCSCCGKRYADQWSSSLSKAMFSVTHRHFVMSVPDALWSFLDNWEMRKVYMGAAIVALNQYFSRKFKKNMTCGIIVTLHPYGKDMKKQPHLHILLTEGAYDKNGKFHSCKFVFANTFRKVWQYHVLNEFQKHGLSNKLALEMYQKYPKGFYVWLHEKGTIKSSRLIAKYVGRYIRHPAIANSRIIRYWNGFVTFYYVDGDSKTHFVEMNVNDFISALIQHIPPKQFKMVRYYGAYSRRSKSSFGLTVKQSGIKQKTLREFGFKLLEKCPKCASNLRFLGYQKTGPPIVAHDQVSLTKLLASN